MLMTFRMLLPVAAKSAEVSSKTRLRWRS